ncbi:MAG: 16S rRNA (cytosine(967)-C(5))-methyltransferase RsmB [Lachnospiraceae bacterium]|nr:16S rRNA (cytosine(967)-C(5))-methyltransferase RsmB [Lachnospiraceae bacterium]
MENIRKIAYETLLAIDRKEVPGDQAVKQTLDKYAYLSDAERSFLNRLLNGTIERRLELDYILGQFNRTGKRIKPAVLPLLRLSVYQLLYMDSVPDRAAVNEAVRLVKARSLSGLSGFVNGLLRTIARERDNIRYPDPKKEYADYLSVRYSVPLFIVELLREQYEDGELEEVLSAQLGPRPLYIRTNQSKTTAEALMERFAKERIAVRKLPFPEGAFEVLRTERIADNPLFHKGLYYISDISSMLAVSLLGIREGDRVIDVCAAPGGKTCHVLELLNGSGQVLARDISEAKTALIRENTKRLGFSGNLSIEEADARDPVPEYEESFDVLIADLPCSGLGVMGRKNDIKYRLTKDSFSSLISLQREILQTVYRYVRIGGTMLFCTCTINRAENEENRAFILDKLPFEPLPFFDKLPKELSRESAKEGYLTLLPKQAGSDGFFISMYRRIS